MFDLLNVFDAKWKLQLWRIKFGGAYVLARTRYRYIALNLLYLTEHSFTHPWVSKVTMEFLPISPKYSDKYSIPIAAPIALTVWHKNRRALVMSGYFLRKCWFIRQLQGARGINIPNDLDWQICFVSACQVLARSGKLKEVRLAHANTLFPYLELPPHVGDADKIEYRKRIQKCLYTTTRQLNDSALFLRVGGRFGGQKRERSTSLAQEPLQQHRLQVSYCSLIDHLKTLGLTKLKLGK
jgi:hypothetical protein